jgi:hypothetical protein
MPTAAYDRLQVTLTEDRQARRILSEFDVDGGRRVVWKLSRSVWEFNQWYPHSAPVLTVIASSENELAAVIRRIGLLTALAKAEPNPFTE